MTIEYLPQVWTPKVGQRVKCMPSPECNHDWLFVKEWPKGHPPELNGATGKVLRLTDAFGNHCWQVLFDQAVNVLSGPQITQGWTDISYYAPHELLPLFALGDRVRIRDAARYCAHRHVGEPGQVGRIVNRYESDSGHVWTVELDELRIGGWTRPLIDEFQDEEMIPYDN